LTLLILIR